MSGAIDCMQNMFCCRCGVKYRNCPHLNTVDASIDDAHAERIRARYAWGREFNPDHDETSYTDEGVRRRAGRDAQPGSQLEPSPSTPRPSRSLIDG